MNDFRWEDKFKYEALERVCFLYVYLSSKEAYDYCFDPCVVKIGFDILTCEEGILLWLVNKTKTVEADLLIQEFRIYGMLEFPVMLCKLLQHTETSLVFDI